MIIGISIKSIIGLVFIAIGVLGFIVIMAYAGVITLCNKIKNKLKIFKK